MPKSSGNGSPAWPKPPGGALKLGKDVFLILPALSYDGETPIWRGEYHCFVVARPKSGVPKSTGRALLPVEKKNGTLELFATADEALRFGQDFAKLWFEGKV